MGIFDFDNVKAEKAKAMFQYNLLKTIQTLFRVTELFLLIILVSWTSSRLPFAVKISGEYFRLLVSVIINPFSIFVIGNVIVLCLLLKSGHLSPHSPISITSGEDDEIYQEYFTGSSCVNPINGGDEMPVPVAETEEIFYEDKETIYEEYNNVKVSDPAQNEILKIDEVGKNLTRSKSENLERAAEISRKLRLSETEKCRGILNYGETAAAAVVVEEEEVHVFDELSNEEFQNAIEAFIAKQLKFHKAEKHAIVLHNQASKYD